MTSRRFRFFALLLPLAAVLPSSVAASALGDGDAPLDELLRQAAILRQGVESLPKGDPAWPALVVNGNRVPSLEVQRTALYFSGQSPIAALRLDMATKKVLDRWRSEGKDISKYTLAPEVFQKKYDDFRRSIEERAPNVSWEQFLAQQHQSEESLAWTLRTQWIFDSVFFPPNPEEWPDETIDAALSVKPDATPQERADLLENIKKTMTQGMENPGGGLAVLLMKRRLLTKLLDTVKLQDALDGLPPEVGFAYGDQKFKTSELDVVGLGLGSYVDQLRAIQFSLVREAVRQEIVAREDAAWAAAKKKAADSRAKGEDISDPPRPVYWLAAGSPEWRAAFEAENARYPSPPFDLPGMVHFRKFPTMEVYRMFFQMIESYRRSEESRITTAVLEEHMKSDELFFSSGQASVECIYYSYAGDPTRGTHEEGYEGARLRAEKGAADIRHGAELAAAARKEALAKGLGEEDAERAAVEAAKGFTFLDVLERDSDYVDQLGPDQQPGPNATFRGRFGPQQRNPLSDRFHENELVCLLQGYSISEHMFFRAPVGHVVGPLRGPRGYYLARTVARTPGARLSNLTEDRQIALVREDYVNHAFLRFVNEVLAKTRVEIGG